MNDLYARLVPDPIPSTQGARLVSESEAKASYTLRKPICIPLGGMRPISVIHIRDLAPLDLVAYENLVSQRYIGSAYLSLVCLLTGMQPADINTMDPDDYAGLRDVVSNFTQREQSAPENSAEPQA